ncbi:MAG TPA: phosphoribosylformylglycinamidine cyclo-ligase [Methanoregulaceae archaeon]|nr:phosphoribosylformylglycinamidine cyclo-ligase [Methanoregulaceae archaeon]
MTDDAYREAGVDIDLEAKAIRALVANLTYRRRGNYTVTGSAGHYAGLIDFGERVFALTVDGVGTKMLVADHLRDWSTVGIDCIAMNVNDLYVMNIEPVAFVDYVATDHLDIEKMAQIGTGLNEGARQANIDIVGGETATLKGLVKGLDLAGTCFGIQDKEKVVTGGKIRPGDLIIGVPSSGIHSNGLTLARKVAEEHGGYDQKLRNGKTLGQELLTPTRIYHESLRINTLADIHGMCHLTGGGLLNFTRLSGYGFEISRPLPSPEIFTWIQECAEIPEAVMYRTFNMGMGYAYITGPDEASCVTREIPGSRVVGEVSRRSGAWLGEINVT